MLKKFEFLAVCIVIAVACGVPVMGVVTGRQVVIERTHQRATR